MTQRTYSLSIKEVPSHERPYEKLESKGPGTLTDAELLAIIIKSGSKHEKSTDLATRLLKVHPEGLLGLHHLTMDQMRQIHGIGRVKAIQLKALSELSVRMAQRTYQPKLSLTSPSTVAGYYMESMRHLDREQMTLVLADTKYRIMGDFILSVGTVNGTVIEPREVFNHALKRDAVNILLLHNHPSGNPEPSPEDIAVTKRISEAGQLLGVRLLDHLIIGDGRFVSLREQGYIN